MSINYYLRATKPRLVYDEFHIGKTSWGYKPHFQDSTNSFSECDRPHAPEYHSVSDIRSLIESGEYILVDEYGEPADLDSMLAWANEHPDWKDSSCADGYRDPDGNLFTQAAYI